MVKSRGCFFEAIGECAAEARGGYKKSRAYPVLVTVHVILLQLASVSCATHCICIESG